MSDQGQLSEIKATLRHWDALYAQHGLAPLPPAVAAQEATRHVNRAQIDWLIAEADRLRAALWSIAKVLGAPCEEQSCEGCNAEVHEARRILDEELGLPSPEPLLAP